MNRRDFQKLAALRMAEAKALLAAGKSDGAYYLAGYVVECAQKACIAKKTRRHDFPPKDAGTFYVHKVEKLLVAAGLIDQWKQDTEANSRLKQSWLIVEGWDEGSRYMRRRSRPQARDLIEAISDGADGVFEWIKRFW